MVWVFQIRARITTGFYEAAFNVEAPIIPFYNKCTNMPYRAMDTAFFNNFSHLTFLTEE